LLDVYLGKDNSLDRLAELFALSDGGGRRMP
jgi:hypothetical protein